MSTLAARENETTVELTTAEVNNRVAAGLYHADVPKLEDDGSIQFDPESGRLTTTRQTGEIIPMLGLTERSERQNFESFLADVQ